MTPTAIPRVGTALADDPSLSALLEATPPHVTAYLAAGEPSETSIQQRALVWRSLREELEAAHAPAEALGALDAAVEEPPRVGALAVVASADGVVHVEEHPMAVAEPFARVGPVPALVPLLSARQATPPYLVALVDRAGADVVVAGGWHSAGRVEQVGDQGTGDPTLRKVNPGGWSQARWQQRAENQWKLHAGQVAERLRELVDERRPHVVLLAGDVRALAELRGALAPAVADLCRDVHGTRHPDGSADATADEVDRLVATVHAEEVRSVLALHREHVARGQLATAGVEDTADALSRAAVATLLLHATVDDGRTAWSSPDGVVVGATAAAASPNGDAAVEGPLADVLARSALLSGARVCIVPSAPALTDGVGALLRF